jgi:hypothetical protein
VVLPRNFCERAWETFQHLDTGTTAQFGAYQDVYDAIPYLHFDYKAQRRFIEWLTELERRLANDEIAPTMVAVYYINPALFEE